MTVLLLGEAKHLAKHGGHLRSFTMTARFAAAATLLLMASAVAAQSGAAPGTVGPAKIPGATREQKLRTVTDALRKADTNNDERITSEEWVAAGGKKSGFDILDYNKDNILTMQELRSNARKLKAYEDFEAAPAY
jgi:hypothetical protein